MRAASSSERPPATWAAAISPWEWPTTAAGETPWACQRRASETITAKRAGWTMSSRSSQARLGPVGAAPRPGTSRRTGRAPARRRRPAPGRPARIDRAPAPSPPTGSPGRGRRRREPGPSARCRGPARRRRGLGARASRRTQQLGPVMRQDRHARVRKRGAGGGQRVGRRLRAPGPGLRAGARQVAPPGPPGPHRSGAESGSGEPGSAGAAVRRPGGLAAAAAEATGPVSPLRTTWQLVPPMPKELTPATGESPCAGQASRDSWTRRPSSSSGISGLAARSSGWPAAARARSPARS